MNTLARPPFSPNQYRSIFISDVHLGSYGCQAEKLLNFLQNTTCDQLFLVGDIIDGWQMRGRVYWPESHERVMKQLLEIAKTGTKVRYITGNHDEFLRNYGALQFDTIEIVDEYRLRNKDGREFLVIHGDQYDVITKYARWISTLGDVGYNLLLRINVVVNKVRSLLGYDYWSFSKWVKDSVKQAVSYVGDFEATVASVCNQRGYAGIICGHIHKAANREVGGVRYLNCGDWVESCTAILHTHDGQFQVIEHDAREKANAADFQADAMADNATSDLPQKEIA
jgi:UDP-2,3-diacylglucosamine pyrophosphatase LpxH|tara:strand:- start:219 stop:1064 length:846 start_codon:yes stop_codon:yes gene_type:complete